MILDWPAILWRATILGLAAGAAVGVLVGLAFGLIGVAAGVFFGAPVGLVCGIVVGVLLIVSRRMLTSIARVRVTGAFASVVVAIVLWASVMALALGEDDRVTTGEALAGLTAVVVFGLIGVGLAPWAVLGPSGSRLAAPRHGPCPGEAGPVQESES